MHSSILALYTHRSMFVFLFKWFLVTRVVNHWLACSLLCLHGEKDEVRGGGEGGEERGRKGKGGEGGEEREGRRRKGRGGEGEEREGR